MSSLETSARLPDTEIQEIRAGNGSGGQGEKDLVNVAGREATLEPSATVACAQDAGASSTNAKVSPEDSETLGHQNIAKDRDLAESAENKVEVFPGTLSSQIDTQTSTALEGFGNGRSQDAQSGDYGLAAPTSHEEYLDPTPRTPRVESSPVRDPLNESKVPMEVKSDSEIQSIMEQFGDGDDLEENTKNWADTRTLHPIQAEHPPRRSSLVSNEATKLAVSSENPAGEEAIASGTLHEHKEKSQPLLEEVQRPIRHSSLPQAARISAMQDNVPPSPGSPIPISKAPLPAPDPEPDLPFDFHRFLEQLRDKSADPVAKYLRSFLIEFGRKQWMVHEQVKLVNDFLSFITNKMARCAVWRDVRDAEFDNAKEGMEKLVMNRLYAQTFSPAIPPPSVPQLSKNKKRNQDKHPELGRQGQHQEDIERDEILGQKVKIYGWVREEHLDIAPVSDSGRRFLILAQQELLKIKNYRAPRDKVICVLNCCKVIFGILKHSKSSDTSADSFVPLLIYVVLHANPDHLVSNVQYILRFRNQDKLGGEAGYYLSSLMGVIQFVENLDRTSLTISDEEFEKNVEAAVSAIAEKHQEDIPRPAPSRPQPPRAPTASHLLEKSGPSMPEVIPRNSIEAEYSSPRKSPSLRGNPGDYGDGALEDNTAVSGLLRTIQKPWSSIGKIFADDNAPENASASSRAPPELQLPQRRLDPDVFQPPKRSEDLDGLTDGLQNLQTSQRPPIPPSKPITGEAQVAKLSAEDAAARQASAEAAEAQRIQRAEHHSVVE